MQYACTPCASGCAAHAAFGNHGENDVVARARGNLGFTRDKLHPKVSRWGPILARQEMSRSPYQDPVELSVSGILTCPAWHRDHDDGPRIPAACLALSLRRRGRSAPRGYLHGIIFGRPGISVSCPGTTHTFFHMHTRNIAKNQVNNTPCTFHLRQSHK